MGLPLGTYKIPNEFKDEDKYFRIFTKSQLKYLAIAVIIGIGLLVFFSKLGLMPVGLTLCIIVILGVAVCVMLPIPEDKYLIGGGEMLGTIVIRVLVKKLKINKVIYMKHL